MSCEDCDKAREKQEIYLYRLGKADISISGCPTHVMDVFDILNKEQHRARAKKE